MLARYIWRSVCRSVVGDDDFTLNTGADEKIARLAHTDRNRLGLVEAGH